VVSGGKEALFEFQRALSTMNFSDFFKDMKEGYDRGKEFAQIMDKLKDDTAYADYINSMKRLESSELRETIKNKTLDISVRTKASNEREAIESEVLERTKAIAKKEYDALAENWAKKNTKNKVSAEEAIKLYEWVQALPKEHVDAMENQFNYNASKVGWEKNKGLDWQAVGVFDKNENERYKQYWMMMKEGEAEVLPKLFELSKKYNVTAKEAQDQYNAVVKENSMLLEREAGQYEKVIKAANSAKVVRDPVTDKPLQPVSVGNIPTLSNGEALKKIDKLAPDAGPKLQNYADEDDLKREMDSLEKINNAKLLSELEYLDEKKKLELAAAQGNATEILAIETKYANDVKSVKIKKAQEWLNFAGGALDALSQFNEAAKQKELDAAGNNAEAKERIEKKYRAKEQAMAISQAIINGALAVTNILATVPGGIANPLSWVAIGLTAATTAAQIAVIGSQKFADGGIVSGPTRALVGEYQGAKNNPEVIAPLNKLNDMIRPAIVAAIAQTGTLKAQKFAGGGLISGPTIGLMGEYPGVRSNPEVVAPLSKLQQMIQPASSGGEVVFRIGERELVGVLVKGDRVKRNIRGR
jgi:hypothetical protein